MKHLNLRLEKLEERIAPGGFKCWSPCGGGSKSNKSKSKGSKSKGSKSKGSKSHGRRCR